MFGPGKNWQSESVSANSRSVIHLCRTTMTLCTQPIAPPNASSVMRKNMKKISRVVGTDVIGCASPEAETRCGRTHDGVVVHAPRGFAFAGAGSDH